MGQNRRLGHVRMTRMSYEQQLTEKLFFRRQIEMLNRMLRSDLNYLPSYRRRWSAPAHTQQMQLIGQSQQAVAVPGSLPSSSANSFSRPLTSYSVQVDRRSKRGSLSSEESDKADRLRMSRLHGSRLRCEVLGPDACQKCIRALDQRDSTCPVCAVTFSQISQISSTTRPDTDSASGVMTTTDQDGDVLRYSPVQIFARVMHREKLSHSVKDRQLESKPVTPLAITSYSPSQVQSPKESRRGSRCESETSEADTVDASRDVKMRVVFAPVPKKNNSLNIEQKS